MEFRPGGRWRFVMRGPDGHDYPNRVTYLAIQAPERIVYKHDGDEHGEPVDFENSITFEELGPNRTRVTMCAVFATAAKRQHVADTYNAVEGGQQTMARMAALAERMAAPAPGSAPFTISRVVQAPRELVWRVWTQQEHLAQWFGPKGCTLDVHACELRTGGVMHYGMRWAGQPTMHGKWVFRAIQAPERLEFVGSFADAQGNTIPCPFPGWPREMLTVVTFEPHAGISKGTVITLRTSAHAASAAEQKTFDDHHGSLQQGWGGTFEQLETFLAKLA